ncbi:exonuclease domain-containing protein [Succinatimonas hippei]|uniref:exonuclease domain-containing protein n=1 Tax=Succinatimonas hippei TaxID=626938 RepID=UPI0023F76C04|nr:exonuclease domain-containing protein [Succinatimonas hippei]
MEYTVNIELNKRKAGEKISKIIFLDTETTGLTEKDKIIELGLISCSCCLKSGRLLSIDKTYSATEDPRLSLNEKIVELTGITDDQIQDTSFNEDEIKRFLRGSCLIVSHNAAFDRPFFERRFPQLKNLSWGCTLSLEWGNYLPGSKRSLVSLMNSAGYTFTAHRAVNDALAVIWLMYVQPDAFKDLLSTVKNGWSKVILQPDRHYQKRSAAKTPSFRAGIQPRGVGTFFN